MADRSVTDHALMPETRRVLRSTLVALFREQIITVHDLQSFIARLEPPPETALAVFEELQPLVGPRGIPRRTIAEKLARVNAEPLTSEERERVFQLLVIDPQQILHWLFPLIALAYQMSCMEDLPSTPNLLRRIGVTRLQRWLIMHLLLWRNLTPDTEGHVRLTASMRSFQTSAPRIGIAATLEEYRLLEAWMGYAEAHEEVPALLEMCTTLLQSKKTPGQSAHRLVRMISARESNPELFDEYRRWAAERMGTSGVPPAHGGIERLVLPRGAIAGLRTALQHPDARTTGRIADARNVLSPTLIDTFVEAGYLNPAPDADDAVICNPERFARTRIIPAGLFPKQAEGYPIVLPPDPALGAHPYVVWTDALEHGWVLECASQRLQTRLRTGEGKREAKLRRDRKQRARREEEERQRQMAIRREERRRMVELQREAGKARKQEVRTRNEEAQRAARARKEEHLRSAALRQDAEQYEARIQWSARKKGTATAPSPAAEEPDVHPAPPSAPPPSRDLVPTSARIWIRPSDAATLLALVSPSPADVRTTIAHLPKPLAFVLQVSGRLVEGRLVEERLRETTFELLGDPGRGRLPTPYWKSIPKSDRRKVSRSRWIEELRELTGKAH